jgi:hypothetical protein
MGMNREEIRAHKLLVEKWRLAKAQIELLPMVEVRPADNFKQFEVENAQVEAGVLKFDVNPVTFFVPERAGQPPSLYITVRGRIYLDQAAAAKGALVTVRFATEVAYFRDRKEGLDHIYGAHFDYELNKVGHPLFHAQMQSYPERVSIVRDEFGIDEGNDNNHVDKVLRTVRVPTAQMDFFAFLVQICADHLIHHDSDKKDLEAFADLRETTKAIRGVGQLLPILNKALCMRGIYWYPDGVDQALA